MSKAIEVVQHLYNGDLDKMQGSFGEAMREKIGEAIADRRLEVASTMFVNNSENKD